MHIQTRGIVLKQNKAMNDMRMLTLFTEKNGKISVATKGNPGRSKVKSSLAYKPFTLGKYDIYKTKDIYRMGNGETVKTFYKIGGDVDKYLEASYVLEFTDSLLPEGEKAPGVFTLLTDYLEILERRTKEISFLTVAFQIKAIQISGFMPELNHCVSCGSKEEEFMFHVESGGCLCRSCATDNGLIYKSDSDIIKRVAFIANRPISVMEKIYLDEKPLTEMKNLIRKFTKYHLDISDLKSEELINKQGKD